jgi:probable DNA repair protein
VRTLDYPTIDLTQLARLAPAEVLVLTVNNRLARTLTAELAATIGAGTAELIPIEPWSNWLSNQVLERLYDSQTDGFGQVLNTQTSRLIWANVIEHIEAGRSLIDIDQLAVLASEADALLLNWQIDVPPAWHTPDFQRFVAWRQAYEARLQALNAIDAPRLSQPVGRWLAQGQIVLAPRVVLLGFTELSMAMRNLLDCMQQAGVQVEQLRLASQAGQVEVTQCAAATPQMEWAMALHWAREKLSANEQGRFAIVVPALQSQAAEARRCLEAQLSGHAYNVAVAPPLAQWGMARAMLAWLRVVVEFFEHGQIEPEVGGDALLAGYCAASQSEAGARALIDARWREYGQLTVTLSQWHTALVDLPQLSDAWAQAQEIWQTWPPGTSGWFEWANRFRAVLGALGFPGQGAQSSVQYQTTVALDQLLSAVAVLDDTLAPPTIGQAWQMLSRLAHQTLFQPQRDRSARLDVLGLLEAEGGRWDGVWVMGVSDDVLPAMVRPNPLIPVAALARAGAPRSTAQREYEWARELMQALRQSAPEVIFSWAERDGEQPKRPSPLVSDLPARAVDATVGVITPDPLVLCDWSDETSIALASQEHIGGGVGVLQAQARNPKWAFFRYRLGVRGLLPYARTPSLNDRGNLLHEVLRALWDRWGEQSQMLQQIEQPNWPAELEALVQKVAAHTLAHWPRVLRALECHRATMLVASWVRVEAKRSPFKVVERESKYLLERGGLALRLTMDRIDQLQDGQCVVIDYKSGKKLPNYARDWQPPLSGDLQLLVYATVLQSQPRRPDALVWIHLHPSALAMVGVADDDVQLEGVQSWSALKWAQGSWTEQLARWDAQIGELADAFAKGLNDNRFWRAEDARYCDIGALLGLHMDLEQESELDDD